MHVNTMTIDYTDSRAYRRARNAKPRDRCRYCLPFAHTTPKRRSLKLRGTDPTLSVTEEISFCEALIIVRASPVE